MEKNALRDTIVQLELNPLDGTRDEVRPAQNDEQPVGHEAPTGHLAAGQRFLRLGTIMARASHDNVGST
jgi:hypothetical protein